MDLTAYKAATDSLLANIPLHCPLHWLTGMHCPTCGLGHSVVAMLQGDFALAWQAQPLGPILLASVPLFFLFGRKLEKWLLGHGAGVAAVLLLFALFRNA